MVLCSRWSGSGKSFKSLVRRDDFSLESMFIKFGNRGGTSSYCPWLINKLAGHNFYDSWLQ
ncbi:hypothetical protein GIB67_008363, partial [Kingdonia uniflora]